MIERFVFHPHTTVEGVLNTLNSTPRGQAAAHETIGSFSSLVQAIHHTQAIGDSSLVHLPDGNTVALVNVPKGEFVRGAEEVARGHYTFF